MRNLILFCYISLLTILSAQGAVTPLEMNTKILGVFVNVDKKTNHITKLVISCEKGKYLIEAHVKCSGKICRWEKVQLKTTGKATYEATYKQGLSQKKLKITQNGKKIIVITNRTYKDSRPPSSKKDVFKLKKALNC